MFKYEIVAIGQLLVSASERWIFLSVIRNAMEVFSFIRNARWSLRNCGIFMERKSIDE